jgi:hypothetical protein
MGVCMVAYRKHGWLASEGALEESPFLGDFRKLAKRDKLESSTILRQR